LDWYIKKLGIVQSQPVWLIARSSFVSSTTAKISALPVGPFWQSISFWCLFLLSQFEAGLCFHCQKSKECSLSWLRTLIRAFDLLNSVRRKVHCSNTLWETSTHCLVSHTNRRIYPSPFSLTEFRIDTVKW